MQRITDKFFNSGVTFHEFIKAGSEEEQDRFLLYYRKSEKKFAPDEYRIDLNHQVNLILLATTWCWDSQTNVPIIERIAEHSPKVEMKIFNKDDYPFLAEVINGGEKVPQLLIFTKDFYYIDRWVERSTKTYELYAETRKELGWNPENKQEFSKEYRKRYLKNQRELEASVIEEIHTFLKRADMIQASTARFA